MESSRSFQSPESVEEEKFKKIREHFIKIFREYEINEDTPASRLLEIYREAAEFNQGNEQHLTKEEESFLEELEEKETQGDE